MTTGRVERRFFVFASRGVNLGGLGPLVVRVVLATFYVRRLLKPQVEPHFAERMFFSGDGRCFR